MFCYSGMLAEHRHTHDWVQLCIRSDGDARSAVL
uniref:Uncharacterized protein n=1 Tax=Anguilla anguilla TaxID=7936 RepID=A0A0E9VWH2_ANGAN